MSPVLPGWLGNATGRTTAAIDQRAPSWVTSDSNQPSLRLHSSRHGSAQSLKGATCCCCSGWTGLHQDPHLAFSSQSISLLPPVGLITTHPELPVLLLLARVPLVSASITSACLLSPKSTPLAYTYGAGNELNPALRPWYLGAVPRLWEDLRSVGRSVMLVTSFAKLSLLWQSRGCADS